MAELQIAMRFLRAAREDPRVAAALRELDPGIGLQPVVQVARTAGYPIDDETLRTAYGLDWGLRRSRFAEAG